MLLIVIDVQRNYYNVQIHLLHKNKLCTQHGQHVNSRYLLRRQCVRVIIIQRVTGKEKKMYRKKKQRCIAQVKLTRTRIW